MLMGRPKTHAKHLPQHMRMKGKSYYHVANNKWTPLGQDEALAKIKWAQLEGVNNTDSFDAAIDKYLASKKFNDLAHNTKRSYLAQVADIRKVFGKVRCKNISASDIYLYMDKHPSSGGANNGLNVIIGALDSAIRAGWVHDNQGKLIKRHTIKGRGRYLEDDEYKLIYEQATPVLRSIMTVAYLTASRMVDVTKMLLSDIKENGVLVIQQKTGAKQLYMWTPELLEAVKYAKKLDRPIRGLTLFCTSRGKPYEHSNLRKLWREACTKAGIENAQFRDLRSKSATDAKEDGQDHQKLLGHTTKAMSDKYVKKFSVEKVEPLRRKI